MSNRNHRFSARFAALAATIAVVASGLAATGGSAQAPGHDQHMRTQVGSNASAMTGLVGPTSGTKPVTTSVTSVAALRQDDLADAEKDLARGAFNHALEHLGDFEQHKDAALGAGWV
jgi:hypothetical protein